jgi:histidinol-phosphate/aromatic aminotransferase/cobyric acid decarboxylase-like protein/choline kinase
MKAIILAAGIGRRMRPLSDTRHKTMLEIAGQTIMGRIMDGFRANGITRVCIVTGYRADEVEAYVRREYPDMKVTFVRNEAYDTTNNIYSMALALEQFDLDDDIVLVESDLIYEPAVLTKLIKSEHANVALVDRYRIGLDGTVVAVSGDSVITSVIPTTLQDEKFDFSDKYKTLNVYKFSAEFCRNTLRKLLTYYARIIDDNCYYELILGILIYMQQVQIHAEILDGELWAEVDDPNDLRGADFAFTPSSRRHYLESSWGGYWTTPVTDFAFIRNMYFPTASMLSQLRGNLTELVTNYSSAQPLLDRKLAYFLHCQPEHVHLLNGASQLFPMLRRWFPAERVLLPEPTFGEYQRAFPGAPTYRDDGGIDLGDVAAKAADSDLVVLVNPNNPTGTTVATAEIQALAARLPDKLILVDESFIEFSGQPSVIPWAEAEDVRNVVVLKSLSKSLGVPGLRLGYVFTLDRALADRVQDELPVWNANSLSEHLLEIILKHRTDLDVSIERTLADRDALAASLGELGIVERVYPSGANFLLVALTAGPDEARRLSDELLEQDNIYVKDVSAKLGGDRAHWRLAVRGQHDNARLCAALRSRTAPATAPATGPATGPGPRS